MARRRIGAAGLLCVMALVAASCTGGGAARPAPVRGGTLRVVDAGDTGPLDPALASTGLAATLARAYARTLYSWDLRTRSERQAEPVPDLAAAPAIRPADGRTWTFTIRSGVRYGPPVNRAVTAADFVTAVERLYGKGASGAGPGRFFADQIAGARDYGAGRARTISGLAASGSTLRVTLERPSASVPPWLALAPFAPVPAEARTVAGLAARPAATGPYMVGAWTPGRSLELVRNPNWDARSDPLRPAWLDRIVIEQGLDPETIQRRIQAGQADLSLDSEPPNRLLHQLATDPVLSRRFALMTTGCLRYLALAAGPGAGPTSDRRVRQAVNWALDRLEVRYARGGPFAGDPAATILSPTMPGFEQSRRYQSADGHADPASARRLLADAGYPNGVSLRSASPGVDKADAVADAVRRALAGAGIRLEPTGAPSRRRSSPTRWPARPSPATRPGRSSVRCSAARVPPAAARCPAARVRCLAARVPAATTTRP